MATIDDVIMWATSLPPWQADAVRRLLIAGEHPLSAEDYAEILSLAKADLKLAKAPDNALNQAIVSESHGGDHDLLDLLTTRSEALVGVTKDALGRLMIAYPVALSEAEFAAGVDMVVRVVLSHVMHPTTSPDQAADDLAWLTSRVLGVPG